MVEKWYFTKQQLADTPSRRSGIGADRELAYRQDAACLIQAAGQRLRVSQLCINTAQVYMHRFYVFHSFSLFPGQAMVAPSLFLAAKAEEQPRRMENVISATLSSVQGTPVTSDTQTKEYRKLVEDLLFFENLLLQTLGFDLKIFHPHLHVINFSFLFRVSRELSGTAYRFATKSLCCTTLCLQYPPTVVAAFCIHLACKRFCTQIPNSSEGIEWYRYVDKTVTEDLLEQLAVELHNVFEKPPRPKRKSPQHYNKTKVRRASQKDNIATARGRAIDGGGRGQEIPTTQPHLSSRSSLSSNPSQLSDRTRRPIAAAAPRVSLPHTPSSPDPSPRPWPRPGSDIRQLHRHCQPGRRSAVTEARDEARRMQALARHATKPLATELHPVTGVRFLAPTRRKPGAATSSDPPDPTSTKSNLRHDSGFSSCGSHGASGSFGPSRPLLKCSSSGKEQSHSALPLGSQNCSADTVGTQGDRQPLPLQTTSQDALLKAAVREMSGRRNLEAFFGKEEAAALSVFKEAPAELREDRRPSGKTPREATARGSADSERKASPKRLQTSRLELQARSIGRTSSLSALKPTGALRAAPLSQPVMTIALEAPVRNLRSQEVAPSVQLKLSGFVAATAPLDLCVRAPGGGGHAPKPPLAASRAQPKLGSQG